MAMRLSGEDVVIFVHFANLTGTVPNAPPAGNNVPLYRGTIERGNVRETFSHMPVELPKGLVPDSPDAYDLVALTALDRAGAALLVGATFKPPNLGELPKGCAANRRLVVFRSKAARKRYTIAERRRPCSMCTPGHCDPKRPTHCERHGQPIAERPAHPQA